jgi:hypothetical protein
MAKPCKTGTDLFFSNLPRPSRLPHLKPYP